MDMSQSKSMAMPSGGIKRNGRRSWLAWNAIVGDAMLTGSAEVVKGKGFAVSKERERNVRSQDCFYFRTS